MSRLTVVPPPPRQKLVEDAVLGMSLFLMAEAMLFAGLFSAFAIVKNSVDGGLWPPPGQPRLPVWETAINTSALMASGVVLYLGWKAFRDEGAMAARKKLLIVIVLGTFFVTFQGFEWVLLLGEGLTIRSSQLGSFFYLMVGIHAGHAIAALCGLVFAYRRLANAKLTGEVLAAVSLFWYFVVGIWPLLYWQVYL
jgi:cytochrome c oxidase subunit 3